MILFCVYSRTGPKKSKGLATETSRIQKVADTSAQLQYFIYFVIDEQTSFVEVVWLYLVLKELFVFTPSQELLNS